MSLQTPIEEAAMHNPKHFMIMKNFDWKKYLNYHLKWQLGIIITAPLMYLFIDYCGMNYWLAVLSFQFVGAIIFYPIDTYIFNKSKGSILDVLYVAPKLNDPIKDQLLNDHVDQLKEEALEEVANPIWEEAKEFADWKAKVPTSVQNNWSNLTENDKLIVYYFSKMIALNEEE